MAPPPTPIYAFRLKKWTLITTKDLLPGDLISLAFKKRSNSPQAAPQPAAAGADKSKIKNEKKVDEQVSTRTKIWKIYYMLVLLCRNKTLHFFVRQNGCRGMMG